MIPLNYILLLGVFCVHVSNGEEKLETYCNINGERALQYVSEKFLSMSIDPAVLLAGLNLSDSSLLLAKHLSPAYIRLAGPSTKFVQYKDNEDKSDDRLSDDGNNVVVTPSMWFGINEWLKLANLTPVFGINDVETARGVWNPKSTLPLLEISDKLNVSCYWQLGFDSSSKSETQYKQDLNILYHLLTAFPERNETWKIIGSDVSTLPKGHTENTMEELSDIVTAVMWEPQEVTEQYFPEKDMGWKILHQKHKPSVKIWTSVPKSSEPISFASALMWARQVGEAAKFGYEVIFRQPRLHEIFSDTPAYWFSLLHKKLMGNNVLDARTTIHYPGSEVYAHCTKKQNDIDGKGALTVMVINSNPQKYKTKVKLGIMPSDKPMEVLSYILTSSAENSTDIYLNGKKLTIDFLSEHRPFEPKRRRTKSKSYISLEVPQQSIGFFVLPDANMSVCVNEEKKVNNMEEIAKEQNLPLPEETVLGLGSRGSFVKNPTLKEMAQKIKKEMRSDERFYKNNFELGELKTKITESVEDEIHADGRKSLIEKAKLVVKQRKQLDLEKRKEDLKKFLSEKTKAVEVHKPETRMQSKSKNLELTSEEVEKILKDRAKARAAQRNILFTDEELDALLQKASKQFLKSKLKRPTLAPQSRRKRDINMQALEKQINLKSSHQDINEDHHHFHETKKRLRKKLHKRSVRSPRDINMKLLDFRTKLAENKQRIEDKRYEILGNAQTIKDEIKDRIRNLKHRNRYKRDINMDLLKIKTEGQKKNIQGDDEKKPIKSLFKNKEDKQATIRRPDQTSAELLEELEEEEEESVDKKKVVPKIEVYAELAGPDEEEEDDIDFINTNIKPKKSSIFDKKSKDPFSNINSTPQTSKKRKKDKNTLDENLRFLKTSEEFTDIEDDLPCIHEFFGPTLKTGNTKNRKAPELGETRNSERKFKKGKRKNKIAGELGEIMVSSEEDPFEELRRKRDTQSINPHDKNHLDVSKSGEEKSIGSAREMGRSHQNILLKDQNDLERSSGLSESQPDSVETKVEKRNVDKSEEFSTFGEEKINSSKLRRKREAVNDELKESGLADRNLKIKKTMKTKLDKNIQDSRKLGSADTHNKSNPKRQIETNGDAQVYTDGINQHLKTLKELILNEKLKLEEKRIKNKSIFADLKKTDNLIKHKSDVVGEVPKIEKEKTDEILEQLQILKGILTQRKDDLDKCFPKDTKMHEKTEERALSKSKDGRILTNMVENREVKSETTDPQNHMKEAQNLRASVGKDGTKIDAAQKHTPPTRHLSKRSLFDKYRNEFGNYKPLAPNLKSWKPSDILSLKRDSNRLSSRNLRPTNEYQLYTSMFDQNRHTMFQKRSINNNLNDIENYIDNYINDIEKDGAYIHPKKISDINFLVPSINSNENRKEDPNSQTILKDQSTSEVINNTNIKDTTVDPIIYYTFDGDFGTEIQSDTEPVTDSIKTFTAEARTMDMSESSQRVFRHLVRNVTGFFKNIGTKIGNYVRHFPFL